MKLGKVKPTATVVAQFPAGLEVEAIQHEGKVFLPVMSMGDFAESNEPKTTTAKSAPEAAPEEKEVPSYTEDELMEKSVKELTKILKDEFGIDPADYEGKNTNKKLRELILDAMEGGEEPEDDSAEDVEDEEETAVDETVVETVVKILEDFDSGTLNKKKTISKLVALGDEVDEDAVAGIIDNFEGDESIEIDDVAEQLAAVISGETKKKVVEKPKSKGKEKSTKKPKEELVELEDLEEGDKVSVYWAGDDFDEWYNGEVKSIKKTRKGLAVTVAYEDDTEDVIDPEVHTKIKRIG
jgi:hypothetical protein